MNTEESTPHKTVARDLFANPCCHDFAAPTGANIPRIRVLFVDDSPDLAIMLARMIRGQDAMEPVGTLSSAEAIVDEVIKRHADVVVMDLTMPGPSSLTAICELVRRVPSCRVIAYSGHDDMETRAEALGAGALELVGKKSDPTDVLRAIRRVANTVPVRVTNAQC